MFIAVRDFKTVFESQVLGFLDQSSDLRHLLELVDTGEITRVDIAASPDNYIHWLIIAKLEGKKELSSLANDYLGDFWKNSEVEPDRRRVQAFLQDIENK